MLRNGIGISSFGLVSVAALLASETTLFSEGFRNPPPGAFSLARAGGRRAQIDTPDAVYHNPANVADMAGLTFSLSPSIIYFKVEHHNQLTGQKAETTDPVKFLPNFFATIPIIENKLAAGFSLTTPFGIGNEWDSEGAFGQGGIFRNAAPYLAQLVTIDAAPTLSWRINDWVALGAGLDVYWSQITLKQFYPPVGPFPENHVRARGDGTTVGANLGVTIDLTESQRLAFTYRAPFTVEYEGKIRFSDATPTGVQESDFRSEIEFPTIVGVGYGIELCDTVRLGADFEWLQFSNFDELPIDAGVNSALFPNFPLPYTVKQDWKDTFTAGLAGDWKFQESWTWRAGYQYYETPVPDHTFATTIPDSDQHAITTGFQFASGRHSAEFGYGYILYNERTIANSGPLLAMLYNGRYEWSVHLFSLAYNFQF